MRLAGPVRRFARRVCDFLDISLVDARTRWGIDPFADLARLTGGDSVRTVFDVGANVGETAVRFATMYPDATIYAFEPEPNTHAILTERTRSVPRIRPVCMAFGDTAGQATLHVVPGNTKVGSLLESTPFTSRPSAPSFSGSTSVLVNTIDRYRSTESVGVIDVLKVDTEGFDLRVLRGASASLDARQVRFVLCEFFGLGDARSEANGELNPIASLLSEHGFWLAGLYTDYVSIQDRFAVRNALFIRS